MVDVQITVALIEKYFSLSYGKANQGNIDWCYKPAEGSDKTGLGISDDHEDSGPDLEDDSEEEWLEESYETDSDIDDYDEFLDMSTGDETMVDSTMTQKGKKKKHVLVVPSVIFLILLLVLWFGFGLL